MLSICCWKWDNGLHPKKKMRFSAGHVNTLFSMIDRHYKKPYRKVCITDDPAGIDEDVKIVPLWDDHRDMGGCFVRLKMFSSDMRPILGDRFVSVDLDCVVVDDLTPLLDRDDDFIIWGEEDRLVRFCGAFWMMDAGVREEVWLGFQPDIYKAFRKPDGGYKGGTDQNRITRCLEKKNIAMWGRKDGVYNFQSDIRFPEKLIGKKKPQRVGRRERVRRRQGLAKDAVLKGKEAYEMIFKRHIEKGRKPATARYLAERAQEKTVDKELVKGIAKLKKEMAKKDKIFVESMHEKAKLKKSREGGNGKLPENARIVFFNGRHDPSEVELHRTYPWIKENWK